ncbi:unnamed protein product [[Actinomadura] parvosata subsp. kistnae]|nr:unnamed protein product [Actinomadura parvosata subsp. kistnae]
MGRSTVTASSAAATQKAAPTHEPRCMAEVNAWLPASARPSVCAPPIDSLARAGRPAGISEVYRVASTLPRMAMLSAMPTCWTVSLSAEPTPARSRGIAPMSEA